MRGGGGVPSLSSPGWTLAEPASDYRCVAPLHDLSFEVGIQVGWIPFPDKPFLFPVQATSLLSGSVSEP